MKYFLDTEFIEDGKTIDLISIGIVAEDGREYYAINADCDLTKASDWVKENVIKQLSPRPAIIEHAIAFDMSMIKNRLSVWRPRFVLVSEVFGFCDPLIHGIPEFWGYYADYDWVVFCQLFGTMMDLPKGFPMYCRDLKQLCDDLGNPKLPEQDKGEHHALADAKWNKLVYEFLTAKRNEQHSEDMHETAPSRIPATAPDVVERCKGKFVFVHDIPSDDCWLDVGIGLTPNRDLAHLYNFDEVHGLVSLHKMTTTVSYEIVDI